MGAAIAGTSIDVVRAQDNLLDELGLPALSWSAAPEDMLAVMKRDKKVRGGVVSPQVTPAGSQPAKRVQRAEPLHECLRPAGRGRHVRLIRLIGGLRTGDVR